MLSESFRFLISLFCILVNETKKAINFFGFVVQQPSQAVQVDFCGSQLRCLLNIRTLTHYNETVRPRDIILPPHHHLQLSIRPELWSTARSHQCRFIAAYVQHRSMMSPRSSPHVVTSSVATRAAQSSTRLLSAGASSVD